MRLCLLIWILISIVRYTSVNSSLPEKALPSESVPISEKTSEDDEDFGDFSGDDVPISKKTSEDVKNVGDLLTEDEPVLKQTSEYVESAGDLQTEDVPVQKETREYVETTGDLPTEDVPVQMQTREYVETTGDLPTEDAPDRKETREYAETAGGSTVVYPSVWNNIEDLRLINRRRRRESYVSCSQSPVKNNMTLKGGIRAGHFHKLAEHVAMQLCVELCCEDKGCDVAFMKGKNCYGVQCFHDDLCRLFPAKRQLNEPILISQVTFTGERDFPKEDGKGKLQCAATSIKVGATIRGGLKAGNFTHIGIVEDPNVCVNFCCMSENCNVALLINERCFLVSCFSISLCRMTRSLTPLYLTSLAYVRKMVPSKGNDEGNFSLSSNISESQLVCKNSKIFHNSTLKGGYRAGTYTNLGFVSNITACIRRCCGNRDCDAAFMLESNCFAVACQNPVDCLPVHVKSSSSSAVLKPRLSYITSRSEEVGVLDDESTGRVCHAGIVSYDVTLRGGSSAGTFTPHGVVNNMKTCIYKCCQSDGCNVAMMLKDSCFTVVCESEEKCEKRQTQISRSFNPRIAYVFRKVKLSPENSETDEKTDQVRHNRKSMKHKKKMMLIQQLHALMGPYGRSTLYTEKTWFVSAEKSSLSAKETSPDSSEEPSLLLSEKKSIDQPIVANLSHSRKNKSIFSYGPLFLSPEYPSSLSHQNNTFLSTDNQTFLSTPNARPSAENEYNSITYKILSSSYVNVPLKLSSSKYAVDNGDRNRNSTEGNYTMERKMTIAPKIETKPLTYFTYNGSKNIFTRIVQGINESSTPTVYDLRLRNFDYSQRRRPLLFYNMHGKQRSLAYLTKKQLMEAEAKSTEESSNKSRYSELFSYPPLNRYHIRNHENKVDPYVRFGNQSHYNNNVPNSTKIIYPLNISHLSFIERIRSTNSKNMEMASTTASNGMVNTSLPLSFIIPKGIYDISPFIRKNGIIFESKKRPSSRKQRNGGDYSTMNSAIQLDASGGVTPFLRNASIIKEHLSINSSEVPTNISLPYNGFHSNIMNSKSKGDTLAYSPYANTTLNISTSLPESKSPKKHIGSSATDMADYISDAIDNARYERLHTTIIKIDDTEDVCFRSKIFYNVTLRGGYDSGKFKDRGKMRDVLQCATLCCHLRSCDLVMMLADRCFSVHCKNEYLCESIPAKSPIYSPTICYVRHV